MTRKACPVQGDAHAPAGALQTADSPCQGCFADPVGTHDAGDRTCGEEELGDVENEAAAALDLQVLDAQTSLLRTSGSLIGLGPQCATGRARGVLDAATHDVVGRAARVAGPGCDGLGARSQAGPLQGAQAQPPAPLVLDPPQLLTAHPVQDTPPPHDDGLVDEAAQEVDAVLGHHEGPAGLFEPFDGGAHVVDRPRVQVGGGLVQEDDGGLLGQGLGAGDLLGLAAG